MKRNFLYRSSKSALWPLVMVLVLYACSEKRSRLKKYFPIEVADNGWDTIYQVFPPFEMLNQDGISLSRSETDSLIRVVHFFVPNCSGPCTSGFEGMRTLHQNLMKDSEILFLSFSLVDSSSAISQIAQTYGADSPRWQVLNGEAGKAEFLMDRAFQVYTKKNNSPLGYAPPTELNLIDREGRVRGKYDAAKESSLQDLVNDIETLKNEYLPQKDFRYYMKSIFG